METTPLPHPFWAEKKFNLQTPSHKTYQYGKLNAGTMNAWLNTGLLG
jgi:hypothetical protein